MHGSCFFTPHFLMLFYILLVLISSTGEYLMLFLNFGSCFPFAFFPVRIFSYNTLFNYFFLIYSFHIFFRLTVFVIITVSPIATPLLFEDRSSVCLSVCVCVLACLVSLLGKRQLFAFCLPEYFTKTLIEEKIITQYIYRINYHSYN